MKEVRSMSDLWTVYCEEFPDWLEEFMQVPSLLRLKGISMSCGNDFTKFKSYRHSSEYSRYDHSVGVALITWHFTKSKVKAIAGLLHDIATPAFSHTIEVMLGDADKQELAEENTYDVIISDSDLMSLLEKYDIKVWEVADYHDYPIVDNKIPKLSADRLEYTLGNLYHYNRCTLETIRSYYNDMVADFHHSFGCEIGFKTFIMAFMFSEDALSLSRLYVSKEARYAMKYLAELIADAIDADVLKSDDLMVDEKFVIDKLKASATFRKRWKRYASLRHVHYAMFGKKYDNPINFKKRYINPIVGKERLSVSSPAFRREVHEFLNQRFEREIKASLF